MAADPDGREGCAIVEHMHWWHKQFDFYACRTFRTCEICGQVEIRSWFRWRPFP